MKLKSIVLQGFRSYRDETRINVENLTAFIGKNDVGKSSILEALEIFFNNRLVKLEIRDLSVFSSGKQIRIGCVFDELSEKVVLDVAAETTLGGECLLAK